MTQSQWSKWRERAGLTQQEVADRVGVERPSVSHLETGRRIPSLSLLRRLCDTLKLSPQERLEAAGLSVPEKGRATAERREAA